MINQVANIHDALKEISPIVQMIHNYVSANECADGVIAVGASPIITASVQEAEQVAYRANSISMNTGTINDGQVESMILAGTMANDANIPIVFDPVGVSFSKYRAQQILKILNKIKVSIIKGNYSEIAFLAGENVSSKGLDTFEADEYDCVNVALKLADKYSCTVILTSQTDIVADSTDVIKIYNGTPMLQKLFCSGDMVGTLAAAYCGISRNFLTASTAATAMVSLAGELAAENLANDLDTGTFKINFFNQLSKIDSDTIKNRLQLLVY
ncbi:hydroxyethylthiazole kinase [bacterium]|nr:hydroxyethylthiazole kinase [bacterium]